MERLKQVLNNAKKTISDQELQQIFQESDSRPMNGTF